MTSPSCMGPFSKNTRIISVIMQQAGRPRPQRPWQRPSLDSIPVTKEEMGSHWFLRAYILLNTVTSIAGLLSTVTNLMILSSHRMSFVEAVVRLYGVLFGVLIVVAEREWRTFFSLFGFLESWLGRGAFQSFAGILLMSFQKEDWPLLDWFRTLVGLCLVLLGLLYMGMALLCFKQFRQSQLTRIRKRKAMGREMIMLQQEQAALAKRMQETQKAMEKIGV